MCASSFRLSWLTLALLVGCAGEDILELSLLEGPNGLPSGFGCVDERNDPLIRDPLQAAELTMVFDVIRFDGDLPASNNLSSIQAVCEDERLPCRVHQRICAPLVDPPPGDQRTWITNQLNEAGGTLEIDDLDVAMFRLVATRQTDACERDAAGFPPLTTSGMEVVGCAYSEVIEVRDIGTQRHYLALDDAAGVCGRADLLSCASVLGF